MSKKKLYLAFGEDFQFGSYCYVVRAKSKKEAIAKTKKNKSFKAYFDIKLIPKNRNLLVSFYC